MKFVLFILSLVVLPVNLVFSQCSVLISDSNGNTFALDPSRVIAVVPANTERYCYFDTEHRQISKYGDITQPADDWSIIYYNTDFKDATVIDRNRMIRIFIHDRVQHVTSEIYVKN
jgi:hypothetical protein